ncbi:hypothetical protein [Brevibacillus reuszeri]|uniref:hypothetical protein n=1 Tax=Brevibacillus reuszeri TaxID=54915 RepID=UPI003D20108B
MCEHWYALSPSNLEKLFGKPIRRSPTNVSITMPQYLTVVIPWQCQLPAIQQIV